MKINNFFIYFILKYQSSIFQISEIFILIEFYDIKKYIVEDNLEKNVGNMGKCG